MNVNSRPRARVYTGPTTRRRQMTASERLISLPQSALALTLALIIGALALLYLSQVAALNNAHNALNAQQQRQLDLQRQDATLHARLGQLESPAYVSQRARAMGMSPADPASVQWITLPGSTGAER